MLNLAILELKPEADYDSTRNLKICGIGDYQTHQSIILDPTYELQGQKQVNSS